MSAGVPSAVPEPEDGVSILDLMRGIFQHYTVQQTPHHYVALALFSAYTHYSGVFRYAPRLVVTSAEKQSGKTRTLDILRELVAQPLVSANASTAALYRSIGDDPEHPPTIILDEADTVFGTRTKAEQNEDLRGLLNAGFQKGTPALRTVGPKHEVAAFDTFAPAVLAAIGALPDTIMDRAVVLRLRRRRPTDEVARYRLREAERLHVLRDRAARWAGARRAEAEHHIPETTIDDRPADVWEPLLTIADLAGGHWPQTARAAATYLVTEAAGADSESSEGIELLADVRNVLTLMKSEQLPTTALLEHLRSIEDSRWKEYELSGHRLASLLKPYGIRPRRSNSQRYYLRSEFDDAFVRYLPAAQDEAPG
ncbi:MAG: DUF3631 domain-containing protein [Leucobacter sp.]